MGFTQQMAAKFFALVALLAVGARASPVFDHSNMANADNTDMQQIEAEFLEQVLNKEVEENIAAFDMLRRSNTSNATGTGGATPVAIPAVDTSLTGSTEKVQKITLSGITASDFNSNSALRGAIEIGYATHIGLYLNGVYVTGASVVASVVRRALEVTMTTTVPNSHLAMVSAKQTNLATGAGGSLSALTSAITTAISNQNVTGVTISVTGAAAATPPTPTPSPTPTSPTTSGASQTAILSVSAIAALVLALRH